MTSSKSDIPKFARVRVNKRAHYDRETVHEILDCGLLAHVGFVIDDRPMVIPMAYARIAEVIYIHGAKAARIIKANGAVPACLTVTHMDGLVVARSAFHHSVNYRSAVVHGRLRDVTEKDEKLEALIAVTDHLLPGRWDEVREMSRKEFNATGVLALEIEAASAKIRSGPPVDDDADYDLPIWAGILPTPQIIGTPYDDGRCGDFDLPKSLKLAKKKFSAKTDNAR